MAETFYRHQSGLILPYKEERRPTCIDFFCGCGGMSLGIIQAGFEVIAGVEWEASAAITYMANLGSYPIDIYYAEPKDEDRLNKAAEKLVKKDKKSGIMRMTRTSGTGWIRNSKGFPPVRNFWFGDIRKIHGEDILAALGMNQGDVDLVCGGPPCQGFSMSGKRNTMDPRNSLVFEFARLICEIMPKTFVVENVPGILSMVTPEGFPVVDAFCRMLEDGGFGGFDALKKTLLNTAGAGAALKTGTKKKAAKKAEKKSAPEESQQLTLF